MMNGAQSQDGRARYSRTRNNRPNTKRCVAHHPASMRRTRLRRCTCCHRAAGTPGAGVLSSKPRDSPEVSTGKQASRRSARHGDAISQFPHALVHERDGEGRDNKIRQRALSLGFQCKRRTFMHASHAERRSAPLTDSVLPALQKGGVYHQPLSAQPSVERAPLTGGRFLPRQPKQQHIPPLQRSRRSDTSTIQE